MTINDWYVFNKDFFNCDFVVKVLKRGSRSNNDILLDSVTINAEGLIEIFDDYEIPKYGIRVVERPGGNGHTIGFCVWPPIN